jgi:hypothetical protein
MAGIVGREPEIAVIENFLVADEAGFAALELVGEAGIGKTTVWQAAVRRAGRLDPQRRLSDWKARDLRRLGRLGLRRLRGQIQHPTQRRLGLEFRLLQHTEFHDRDDGLRHVRERAVGQPARPPHALSKETQPALRRRGAGCKRAGAPRKELIVPWPRAVSVSGPGPPPLRTRSADRGFAPRSARDRVS